MGGKPFTPAGAGGDNAAGATTTPKSSPTAVHTQMANFEQKLEVAQAAGEKVGGEVLENLVGPILGVASAPVSVPDPTTHTCFVKLIMKGR